MGAFGTNYAEVRGRAYEFPAAGHIKKAMWQRDESWWQLTTEVVLQGSETQSLSTYLDRQQATVAEWVDLWPILMFLK